MFAVVQVTKRNFFNHISFMEQSILLLSVILLQTIVYGQDNSDCRTPHRKPGRCISIKTCYHIVNFLKNRILTENEMNFMTASQCVGGVGKRPHICCGIADEDKFIESNPDKAQTSTLPPFNPEKVGDGKANILPDPLNNECGVSLGNRIYGGTNTEIDEFPWLALLQYRKSDGSLTFSCGGTVINQRYILTAAHCVTGEILTAVGTLENVRLGEYNTKTEIDCIDSDCADPPQDIRVSKAIPHADFSTRMDSENLNDIALVRLSSDIKFNDYVQAICLPHTRYIDARTGDVVYVTGFGRTLNAASSDIKQKLNVTIYDQAECQMKFESGFNRRILNTQLCAGGVFAEDTCRGDSGGPLMRQTDAWYLEGIVSYGNKCGLEGWPGVYTRVSQYMNWIRQKLEP
uniref:CLIP domain-containing serine protease n=1 Tax=Corethrella appendiculata TaxID=1370023 RepID=U5ESH9_9DIPT